VSISGCSTSRYPFLIKVNGHLAGFVLLQKGSQISGDEGIGDVAEFFIVRGYRRLGVGMKAAHEVWKRFPGKWEVRVIVRNQRAKEFWARAIGEFLGGTIQLFSKRMAELGTSSRLNRMTTRNRLSSREALPLKRHQSQARLSPRAFGAGR
jgi:predicted acetyltransferase